jgi:hypothetical protein
MLIRPAPKTKLALAPLVPEAPPGPPTLLLALLGVLFLGPLIAPLFQASGLPLLAPSGMLARDLLASYVCPTPAKSYLVLGHLMAVCARCWGATIGLWGASVLLTPARGWLGGYFRLPLALHLAIALLAFLLWPLEIGAEARGWLYTPRWLLLLNGAQAGLLGGLFFASAWSRLYRTGV